MHIILNHSSMIPIYEQLVEGIKHCIVTGDLHGGEILPSVRQMAAELNISALTVKKAYDRLEEEGIVVTVHGKGSYVSDNNTKMIEKMQKEEIERYLKEAIERAIVSGIKEDEIQRMVGMMLEGYR